MIQKKAFLTPDEYKANQETLNLLIRSTSVKALKNAPRAKVKHNGHETEGFSLLPCDECEKTKNCKSRSKCIDDIQLGRGLSSFVEKGSVIEVKTKKKIKRSPPDSGVGWGEPLRNQRANRLVAVYNE